MDEFLPSNQKDTTTPHASAWITGANQKWCRRRGCLLLFQTWKTYITGSHFDNKCFEDTAEKELTLPTEAVPPFRDELRADCSGTNKLSFKAK